MLSLVLLVAFIGIGVDAVMTHGRVYAGVSVGTVDLSGMTKEEAVAALDDAYAQVLAESSAVIYASADAKARVEAGQGDISEIMDQISVEEARAMALAWTPTADSLGASLPSDQLADEALAIGRSDGGIFGRAKAALFGEAVPVRAQYNQTSLEELASAIDASIGSPRVDCGVVVEDGMARATEGHDGMMVDRAVLAAHLDSVLFLDPSSDRSFIAQAEYAPLRITYEIAQAACELVNAAIADGAVFTYGTTSWKASAALLGTWVVASPVELPRDSAADASSSGWYIALSLDEEKAKASVFEHVKENAGDSPFTVSFDKASDGSIVVKPSANTYIPMAGDAVARLETALFGEDGRGSSLPEAQSADGNPVSVTVESRVAPQTLSFEDAVDMGVITAFSSFTTEYTTGSGTEERNHNIRLAADRLNDSVAPAGGSWSFNNTAGECNEEGGFLAAGAIVNGEYVDSIGGGICQVATTVFNAVYDAGLPVKTRHNHTLYISSYPAGRDAAVSWPDLDLVWNNSLNSDVLLKMSYTDGTLTATLYGVDPEFSVSSNVGSWQEGEKHKTRYIEDPSLGQDDAYVKTAGTDGKSIMVTRTVKSADGTLVSQDAFYSEYDSKTEVIVCGPGYEEKKKADEEKAARSSSQE